MNTKYSVGIDMSKKDFKACFVVFNDQQDIKVKASRAFANTPTGFEQFKAWWGKHQKEGLPIVFVMEATGSYHEYLVWYLNKGKQDVSIVLPNRAKAYMVSIGLKSKNDKVDAQGLARMGAVQKLGLWQPISQQIYSLRSLTRHLEDLQQIRTSLINQQEQRQYAMYELKAVATSIKNTLKAIDRQIVGCKKKIHSVIEKDKKLSKKVKHMTSIKGVSILTVAVVIAETSGFALITNTKQIVSYAGYDVKENQSGTRDGKTRITKKGNAHIRRAMHLPAFNVVRHHLSTFENLYERIYEKRGIKMKAYVAVQSKLLRMMYTLWKNEVDFDPNYGISSSHEPKLLCSVDPIGAKDKVDKKTAESFDSAALDGLPCNQSPEDLCSVQLI